jgi:uncharacterized membrane protein (UPF0127 family)
MNIKQEDPYANQDTIDISTEDGEVSLIVEYADTEAERRDGLMGRTTLDSNSGMLFVFSDEQERVFWMKDTYIPLDIIFIDGAGKIINIAYDTKTNQTYDTYSSNGPAKYVIEVNAGWCKNNNVQMHDQISLDSLDLD